MLDHLTRRRLAAAYVAGIRKATFCAHCGAQPIEWHNPDHVAMNRQHFRISAMVSRAKPLDAIRAEMDACTALCRRCHMAEDGRLRQFVIAGGKRFYGGKSPGKPCTECNRISKPRRQGLCSRCYDRRRRPAAHRPIPNICSECSREYRPLRKLLCVACYTRARKRGEHR